VLTTACLIAAGIVLSLHIDKEPVLQQIPVLLLITVLGLAGMSVLWFGGPIRAVVIKYPKGLAGLHPISAKKKNP
jgi:hypothetical protein